MTCIHHELGKGIVFALQGILNEISQLQGFDSFPSMSNSINNIILHKGDLCHPIVMILQCACHPELLEYPHAIVCDNFWNSTLFNFIKILIWEVLKVGSKYGMLVL